VRKFLIVATAIAGVGYAAWQYWVTTNEANARAWANGTDKTR
jgi:predicted negative regulator of RcsB-dependent stress response